MRTAVEDGALVKRAAGPAAVARLRAEAERLRAAEHPGVVRLLASSGDEDGWELRLAHGGRPVAVGPRPTVEQVGALVAAAAATLADLHEAGIVHGRLDSSHLLVGPNGRVQLCGLGPGGDADPADDVAALGQILTDLLGDAAEPAALPDRRFGRPPRRTWLRRSLLLLADQATAEPATRRPTARRLQTSLDALLQPPERRLRIPPRTGPARPAAGEPGPPPPRRALLSAVAGLTILALAVTVHAGRERAPGAAPWPRAACVPAPAAGGGCAAEVQVDGTLAEVDGVVFQIGQPGDVVALGDWDCDGAVTPALVRPATGAVFAFTAWAGDAPLEVPALAVVPGARSVAAAGCGRLAVATSRGTVEHVEVP